MSLDGGFMHGKESVVEQHLEKIGCRLPQDHLEDTVTLSGNPHHGDVIDLSLMEGLGPLNHVHPVGIFVAKAGLKDPMPGVDKIMRCHRITVTPLGFAEKEAPGPPVL